MEDKESLRLRGGNCLTLLALPSQKQEAFQKDTLIRKQGSQPHPVQSKGYRV